MKKLNGKIRCVKVWDNLDSNGFVEGNTYDIINGKLILPNGSKSINTYYNIEHINECFYAIFEEVKNESN